MSNIDYFKDKRIEPEKNLEDLVDDDEYKTHTDPIAFEDISVFSDEPIKTSPKKRKIKLLQGHDMEKAKKNREKAIIKLEQATQVKRPKNEEENYEEDENQEQLPQGDLNDPNMMGNDAAGMNGGMGMDGMGVGMGYGPTDPEKEPKSGKEIGRIYELKKIYSRLLSIESHLSISSNIVLQKLRKYVAQAIDLFEMIISNSHVLRGRIDEVIIQYYKFLEEVFDLMRKFYELEKKKENKDKK